MIDAPQLRFQVRSYFDTAGVHHSARMVALVDMTPEQRTDCLKWCEGVMAEPWYSKADHTLQQGLWTEKIAAAAEWLRAQP
jgi:hypothetical protein